MCNNIHVSEKKTYVSSNYIHFSKKKELNNIILKNNLKTTLYYNM
jgi:hypothetical protein